MNYSRLDNITNYAIKELTSCYKKERIIKMISALTDDLQAFSDELSVFNGKYNINSSSGHWLDLIGEIVGEKRKGREDNVYRRFLWARIGINTSKGTPENVINVWKLLIDCDDVVFEEFYPGVVNLGAGCNFLYEIVCDEEPCFAFEGFEPGAPFNTILEPESGGPMAYFNFFDVESLFNIMDKVLLAGVRLGHFFIFDPDNFFAFEEYGPGGNGLGIVGDDSVGGDLAIIIERGA
jgi:hypothetical protein